MASSKTTTSLALFLALNLLFFNLVAACGRGCPTPSTPTPSTPTPSTPTPTSPSSGGTGGTGGTPSTPTTPSPSTGGTGGTPSTPTTPSPSTGGTGGTPSTPTTPSPSTGGTGGTCPRDALKLGVCADVLGSLLNITIGTPPVQPCCTLIQGLADLEAAICLCTAIRANILGINLNIPISLSLLLNVCSRNVPRGFVCP